MRSRVVLLAIVPIVACGAVSPAALAIVSVTPQVQANDADPVRHDAKDPGPGDDQVHVNPRVERVSVAARSDAPILGSQSAREEVDPRTFSVPHPVFTTLEDADRRVDQAAPDARRWIDIYVGPDGWTIYYDLLVHTHAPGDSHPIPYPDRSYELDGGVGYDRITVPWRFLRGSDFALEYVARVYDWCVPQGATGICYKSLLPHGAQWIRALAAEIPEASLGYALGPLAASLNELLRIVTEEGAGGFGPTPDDPTGLPTPGDLSRSDRGRDPPAQGAFGATAAHGTRGGSLSLTDAGGWGTALPTIPGSSDLLAVALLATLAILPGFALYRRLRHRQLLEQDIRSRILEAVRNEPGIHERGLARKLSLHRQLVSYHARMLVRFGLLVASRDGRHKRYVEPGLPRGIAAPAATCAATVSDRILALIEKEPGIGQRDVARRLGIADSSAKWQVDRLAQGQAILVARDGGRKRLFLPGPGPAVVGGAREPTAAEIPG